MKPAPVMQPPESMLCGHACVASLARVSLKRATAAVGKRGGTCRKDLDRGLRALTGRGLVRSYQWPRRGLAFVKWDKRSRKGHWLALINGELRDPWTGGISPGWRITSYWALRAPSRAK